MSINKSSVCRTAHPPLKGGTTELKNNQNYTNELTVKNNKTKNKINVLSC